MVTTYTLPVNGKPGDTFSVSARCGSSSAPIDVILPSIDTDSDNDGKIDLLKDDPIETDAPGRLLRYNGDDDNHDDIPDRDEPGDKLANGQFAKFLSGEDDLAQVDLKTYAGRADMKGFKIRLGGGGNVKVWTSATKGAGNEINLPKEYVIGQDTIPSTIWAEGFHEGASALTMRLIHSNGLVLCDDAILLTVLRAIVRVDGNRDGSIDLHGDSDLTTKDKPYKFWLNNDHDVDGDFPFGEDKDDGVADSADKQIGGLRDLEDFSRLHIKAPAPFMAEDSSWRVTLGFRKLERNVFPALHAFSAVKPGMDYLMVVDTAKKQLGEQQVVTAGPGEAGLQNQAHVFSNPENPRRVGALLFEGVQKGKGLLTVRFYKNNQLVAEDGTWVELKDIKEMYERAEAFGPLQSPPTDGTANLKEEVQSNFHVLSSLGTIADEEPHGIAFVHGWNNTFEEYLQNSETMFKRLYWASYKGRFSSLRWPTTLDPTRSFDVHSFGEGEFIGWRCGTAMNKYLRYLQSREATRGYAIHVVAHSQGNDPAGDGIRQQGTGSPRRITCYSRQPCRFTAITPMRPSFLTLPSSKRCILRLMPTEATSRR